MMNDDARGPADSELLLEEAEALIWALLDDHLDAADSTRLSQLLESSAAIRARYLDCIQLHVDLRERFAAPAEPPQAKPGATPVLSNLTFGGLPGLSSLPTLHD